MNGKHNIKVFFEGCSDSLLMDKANVALKQYKTSKRKYINISVEVETSRSVLIIDSNIKPSKILYELEKTDSTITKIKHCLIYYGE